MHFGIHINTNTLQHSRMDHFHFSYTTHFNSLEEQQEQQLSDQEEQNEFEWTTDKEGQDCIQFENGMGEIPAKFENIATTKEAMEEQAERDIRELETKAEMLREWKLKEMNKEEKTIVLMEEMAGVGKMNQCEQATLNEMESLSNAPKDCATYLEIDNKQCSPEMEDKFSKQIQSKQIELKKFLDEEQRKRMGWLSVLRSNANGNESWVLPSLFPTLKTNLKNDPFLLIPRIHNPAQAISPKKQDTDTVNDNLGIEKVETYTKGQQDMILNLVQPTDNKKRLLQKQEEKKVVSDAETFPDSKQKLKETTIEEQKEINTTTLCAEIEEQTECTRGSDLPIDVEQTQEMNPFFNKDTFLEALGHFADLQFLPKNRTTEIDIYNKTAEPIVEIEEVAIIPDSEQNPSKGATHDKDMLLCTEQQYNNFEEYKQNKMSGIEEQYNEANFDVVLEKKSTQKEGSNTQEVKLELSTVEKTSAKHLDEEKEALFQTEKWQRNDCDKKKQIEPLLDYEESREQEPFLNLDTDSQVNPVYEPRQFHMFHSQMVEKILFEKTPVPNSPDLISQDYDAPYELNEKGKTSNNASKLKECDILSKQQFSSDNGQRQQPSQTAFDFSHYLDTSKKLHTFYDPIETTAAYRKKMVEQQRKKNRETRQKFSTKQEKKRAKFKPPRVNIQREEAPLIDKFVRLKEATFARQNQYMMSTSTRPKLEKKIVFKREQLTHEEEQFKEQLKKELATLDAEMEELLLEKEKHDQQLQALIEDLHRYNDLKDTAQNIFGRLAELEGTTTKEMYKRYDLELED